MNTKTHEQSRFELVAGFIVGFVLVILAAVLIGWAATVPLEDPRNEPRPGVTEFAVHPYSA